MGDRVSGDKVNSGRWFGQVIDLSVLYWGFESDGHMAGAHRGRL